MVADIPADVAYIGGVWAEGVLYGIHIILFSALCKIFLRKSYVRGREVSSAILLCSSFIMFVLSTTHVALAVHELLQGFVYQRSIPGGPPVFFRQNVFPPRKAVYLFNTFLGDAMLIWRVYVIWGQNWKICVPSIIFLLGTIICGIKTIVANATYPAGSVFTSDILSWVTSTFALTIATQITATCLIAGRIYYASRLSIGSSKMQSYYMSLVWMVVESGAIYTVVALIQLITEELGMNAGVIMELMLSQLSAMIPILIVVRVGLGLAHDGKRTGNTVIISTFRAANPAEKEISFGSGGSATVALSPADGDNDSRSHPETSSVV